MQKLVLCLMVFFMCNGFLMHAAAEKQRGKSDNSMLDMVILTFGMDIIIGGDYAGLKNFIKKYPKAVSLRYDDTYYEQGVLRDHGSESIKATLLMEAAYRGHLNLVEFLCENGANPLIMDRLGNRARDYAYSRDKATIMFELLQDDDKKIVSIEEANSIIEGIVCKAKVMRRLLSEYEQVFYRRVQQSVEEYIKAYKKTYAKEWKASSVPGDKKALARHVKRIVSIVKNK